MSVCILGNGLNRVQPHPMPVLFRAAHPSTDRPWATIKVLRFSTIPLHQNTQKPSVQQDDYKSHRQRKIVREKFPKGRQSAGGAIVIQA